MGDFFAFLVEDVLMICLPQSCRREPPGLGSPEKICDYDDELSQYSLKNECVWVLSLGISSDLRALFPLCICSFVHRASAASVVRLVGPRQRCALEA